ncbi:MAG TPA: ABC transporter ATP-binding protein [Candidatus Limiplasma sp.]|nr:ABC transporter ATP-binding protein [Candidatus Limiplasma sp.]
MALLEIKDLCVQFQTRNGVVNAVRDVSLQVDQGELLGIVGESGSGKSVCMLALMGLLASNGRITGGQILFDGQDISPLAPACQNSPSLYEKQMKQIRGNRIGMVFQDPMTFLNPVLKVGTQITEGILSHERCSRAEAKNRALQLMRQVGIPGAEERFRQYPFEFSGGMRQRIVIAIALACNPKLIIADEPTTALDVTVQAQIIELLKQIAKESHTAVVMITHDLGVVAKMCDTVNIMYAGKMVEKGTVDEIFYQPRHPYTMGLLRSVGTHGVTGRQALISIPGTPPDLLKLNTGCAFMPRCAQAMKICKDYMPCETLLGSTHSTVCWQDCKNSADEVVAAACRDRGNL